jgi:hypothetical protein
LFFLLCFNLVHLSNAEQTGATTLTKTPTAKFSVRVELLESEVLTAEAAARRQDWLAQRDLLRKRIIESPVPPLEVATQKADQDLQRFRDTLQARTPRGRFDVDIWTNTIIAPRFMVQARAYAATIILGLADLYFKEGSVPRKHAVNLFITECEKLASQLWKGPFEDLCREWNSADRDLWRKNVFAGKGTPVFDYRSFSDVLWHGGSAPKGDGPLAELTAFLIREFESEASISVGVSNGQPASQEEPVERGDSREPMAQTPWGITGDRENKTMDARGQARRSADRRKWKPEYRQIVEQYEGECRDANIIVSIASIFDAAGINKRSGNGYKALRGEREGYWIKIKRVCTVLKPHLQ